MEDTVVRPNAGSDLLIDSYAFRFSPTEFVLLCRVVKFSVLGKASRWVSLRLVYNLRIAADFSLWMIVPLVD